VYSSSSGANSITTNSSSSSSSSNNHAFCQQHTVLTCRGASSHKSAAARALGFRYFNTDQRSARLQRSAGRCLRQSLRPTTVLCRRTRSKHRSEILQVIPRFSWQPNPVLNP